LDLCHSKCFPIKKRGSKRAAEPKPGSGDHLSAMMVAPQGEVSVNDVFELAAAKVSTAVGFRYIDDWLTRRGAPEALLWGAPALA
jgi:hypothetical protein